MNRLSFLKTVLGGAAGLLVASKPTFACAPISPVKPLTLGEPLQAIHQVGGNLVEIDGRLKACTWFERMEFVNGPFVTEAGFIRDTLPFPSDIQPHLPGNRNWLCTKDEYSTEYGQQMRTRRWDVSGYQGWSEELYPVAK